jgi:hypothetical protein
LLALLPLLSGIFGFAAPFIPELLKIWKGRQDNQHELAMMDLRLKAAAAEHAWRMEEINANADIQEAIELHKPMQSWGVQLLDKADSSDRVGKLAFRTAFCLFVWLDWLSGMVRPTVTYLWMGLYIAVKAATFHWLITTSELRDMTIYEALKSIWYEHDYAIMTLCLSYWFGHRAAKATFGGSAMTSYRGGT